MDNQMRNAIAPFGIAVLTVLAVTATSSASFAQAGSTGGTIGKQDKSLSGDDGSYDFLLSLNHSPQ